ncbi:hypothetical protein AC1031_008293 [Aphanomyces cochlioides]|nr:hypothetical protein AC1031_008293 [Aphanomyces cochlioides]
METSRRKRKKRCLGITLMDVVKANGMRVVEGTKLNLVGKGIDQIGDVVASIAQTTTCLYLSQNNIASLEGLTQFTRLKVLSLGGNLLARFEDFDGLDMPQLRTLLLSGNPICDAPNYRLRMIVLLPKVQTLDGTEVTPKERELAPFLAAQDASLRQVVLENHMEISKLEWIVLLIQMHKEFYQVVHQSHERMPHLESMAINVSLLLRLWKYEDSLVACPCQPQVDMQLQRVVIRALQHLQQHPLRKAKQLLQKFAHSSQRLKNLEPPTPPTWKEAYASVISLQQNTIAKLRGLCERNRRELIDALKSMLVRDPSNRLQQARQEDEQRRLDLAHEREQLLRQYQNGDNNCLPPQQPDPDEGCHLKSSINHNNRPRRQLSQQTSPIPPPPPRSVPRPITTQNRDRDEINAAHGYNLKTTWGDNNVKVDGKSRSDSDDDTLLRRQLDLVEKRLHDMDARQQEERRLRHEQTLLLEEKLRQQLLPLIHR